MIPDESIYAMYLVKTHYIMKVRAFHPEDQTVDLVQDVYEFGNIPAGQFVRRNEFGEEIVVGLKTPDLLYGIPVKQERWGQWNIQCCPKEGDTGYIEVMTNDIQDWVENGSQSIPWSDDHFLKKSCVFVPFVPNKKNCDKDYPTTNDTFVLKSNNINVTMSDTEEGKEKITVTMKGITLNIDASGQVSLSAPDATLTAECKTLTATASESATIDTPTTTITGNLNVGGNAEISGNSSTGGETILTGAVTMAGTLNIAGAVTAADISALAVTCASVGAGDITTPMVPSMNTAITGLLTHTHRVPGVQTGSGATTTDIPTIVGE